MDRKVKQKQNISTIAACDTIMFLNNKTADWLNLKSEEELAKAITVSRKAAPLKIKYYREKKRQIVQSRVDSLEKKKIQNELKSKKNLIQERNWYKNLKSMEEFGQPKRKCLKSWRK